MTAFDPIVALNCLTRPMIDALEMLSDEAKSAEDLGIGSATLGALGRHGLAIVDRHGHPYLYFLSPAGQAVIAALHADVVPVESVGRIERIKRFVAEYYRIPEIEMISERRSKLVARPRQVAMYLSKQLTTKSLPTIGREFGGRDHTTILYGIRKVEALMSASPAFEHEVKTLQEQLCSKSEAPTVDKPHKTAFLLSSAEA